MVHFSRTNPNMLGTWWSQVHTAMFSKGVKRRVGVVEAPSSPSPSLRSDGAVGIGACDGTPFLLACGSESAPI